MCGILGSVNLAFSKESLGALAHRGPDDSGIITEIAGNHRICLGQTRLAIVDLSPSGHQPMVSACGRYVIIFNGEIYNHLELRGKLPEVSFRGSSDTETLLYYLAEFGENGLNDLNGIFAFAFLDKKINTIILCRDPFGVKPLYYWQEGHRLVFASEIAPVQKLVNDTVSLNNLATLLCLRYSPSPDTLFKKIHKIRPGHALRVKLNDCGLGLKFRPYAFACERAAAKFSFAEAADNYGFLLQQAVKRQLMSDVEVGVLLSGGIDSALVAKFAQMDSSRPLKGFTVGFTEEDASDEISDAQETARQLGLDSIITRIGFEDFLEIIKACVAIVEEPLATTSIIPMYYLAKLAAQKVKVVLSGQGADESLGGYGRYQGELLHRFLPPALAVVGNRLFDFLGLSNDQLRRGFSALRRGDDVSRFLSAYSVFSDHEIEKLVGLRDTHSLERVQYFYSLLGCSKIKTSVERMMAVDLRMNLADDLLLYTDKVTMHFSLECRVPMLDLDLVKYIQSLPCSFRVKVGQSKIVHREYAKMVLPDSIINRKKKGFQSPTKKWFAGHGPVWDILLAKEAKFASYFDLSEVEKVLLAHEKGINQERQIFLLLCLNYWFQKFA
ncbi:MAG: asparagine synthase (glutamine-hydrolyzing) [Deltaproteobacteria bacterium]|nr:asparagine synthase (glutamine-hydrolyzing) [Deltaproteobacteria bacterium]